MAENYVNLVKLCVGINSVAELEEYRARQSAEALRKGTENLTSHVTRMWPKRADELLNGGSLYWVIKGVIQARQTILRFDERIGGDGIRRCAVIMDPALIRTQGAVRRPFQGWRYLAPGDSPPDLPQSTATKDDMPLEMQRALAEIGLR